MLRAEHLLFDRQRPFVQRLGLGVGAGSLVEQSEIVQARRRTRMLRAEHLLMIANARL